MIKHCHQRPDEHNHGQHVERDRETEVLLEIFAENELDAILGIVDDVLYAAHGHIQCHAALRHVQHKRRDSRLHEQCDKHRAAVDRRSIGRQQVAEAEHREHAADAHEDGHQWCGVSGSKVLSP